MPESENLPLDPEQVSELATEGWKMLLENAPGVILAIITLFVGLWLIKRINRLAQKAMQLRKFDPSLLTFMSSLISIGLRVLLIVTVAGMIGIATTSFVAILGAAGLAVGLALQGSLANFAGGVLILLLKPYKVGDLVEMQGELGTIEEIRIFNTVMVTFENETIFLPNGAISNGNIKNYTLKGLLRVDLVIGIAYNENIKKAREALLKVMRENPKVLQEPEPSVHVLELADSSINLGVRPYTTPEDYWSVYFETLEGCKEALDREGIVIPFPQRDIHVKSGKIS